MIILKTEFDGFFSDICEVVRLFWPDAEIALEGVGASLIHHHEQTGDEWVEAWAFEGHSITHRAKACGHDADALEKKRMLKRCVKTGLYLLMMDMTNERPPWGSLTGIRPTRLLYEAISDGMTMDQGMRWIEDTFYVYPEKAKLLGEILTMQRGLIERAKNTYDVYIGIPFCVTRCAYCSFAAGELGDGRLVEPYLMALFHEMDETSKLMRESGQIVRACYMGGGTPTALTVGQLERVLDRAQVCFPGAIEWTVEAGRPDTIDEAKLRVMREHNIDRISINPQTFSDETLKRIGRSHNCDQTIRAYDLARSIGFDNINMDLICALPGESLSDFGLTLERVCALSPESVTVHTLAIKRASRLRETGYVQASAADAGAMVDLARRQLNAHGYNAYYLYRQKYMAGNLENVGYAKPGYACVYNIDIMEETAPILALGSGAITKWLFDRERRIERAPNVKNIEQYIGRVDEMIERKCQLILGG